MLLIIFNFLIISNYSGYMSPKETNWSNWFFKKTAEKTIVLAKNELSPTPTETPAVDVYPFNLKFPQRIPPSFDAPQCAFFAGSSFLPEEFELSLDKTMVYYGEKLDLRVAIDNNSNKRIRRIKCQLIQLSLLPFVGERRKPFSCLETKECWLIHPGASRYWQRAVRIGDPSADSAKCVPIKWYPTGIVRNGTE